MRRYVALQFFFSFLSFQRACAWDRRNVGSVAQQISTPFFLETSPCSLEDFAHFPYRNSGIPPSHQSDGHKTSTPHPLPTTHTAKHSHKCMYTAVNTGHAVYVSLVFYFFLSENFKLTSLTSHVLWSRGEGTFSRNQRGQNLLTLLPETMHSRSIPYL